MEFTWSRPVVYIMCQVGSGNIQTTQKTGEGRKDKSAPWFFIELGDL